MKVDDSTFKMIFELPNGLLIKNMNGAGMFVPPAAYMKQFHIKYNKDKVEQATKDAKHAGLGGLLRPEERPVLEPGAPNALWPGK